MTGANLVITVDLGIAYNEAIRWCAKHNLPIIITDHHEPNGELPTGAVALVNPKLGSYQDPMICGAATAFQFARALLMRLQERKDDELLSHIVIPETGWEKWLVDLAGFATIADLVPLVKENRILATYGLQVLRQSRNRGLRALISRLRLSLETLDEEDIAFSIVPHINAASRLDHPEHAYRLLMAKTNVEATAAADYLISLNKKRKTLVATLMKKVHSDIDKKGRKFEHVLVIGDPDWNHGVLGLVASKIVDIYGASAFVWSRMPDGTIKGSCRSANGTNVMEVMSAAKEGTFIQFGGHDGAGGFSCEEKNIHHLQQVLEDAYDVVAQKNIDNGDDQKIDTTVYIDEILEASDINEKFYQQLRQLGPFGMGNPKPIFAIRGTCLLADEFGKDSNHVSLILKRGERGKLRCRKFFMKLKHYNFIPKPNEPCVIIGTITKSNFAGRTTLEVDIIDILETFN